MPCIDVTIPPLTQNRPLVLVVAAALINKDNQVLLAERPKGKSMPGLWEFPGGKLNTNETPEAALVRELFEELGVKTSVGCLWPISFASHPYAEFHLLMPLFACRVWEGDPFPKEGQKIAWVNKSDLKSYSVPAADVPLISAFVDWVS